MPTLYHIRATIDYLASAPDRKTAEGTLCEAMFDAEPDEMTVIVSEFKPGDRLPHGWELDSTVYGDEALTVADCLARAAAESAQIALPLGSEAA